MDDVISDLKQQLLASRGYPIDQQRITCRVGFSRDADEVVDDSLVRDFARSSTTLRVIVTEVTKSFTTGLPGNPVTGRETNPEAKDGTSNNRIGELETSESGSVIVGNFHSETVMSHGSYRTDVALNVVTSASVKGNAKLRVGDKFGGRDPDE